MKKLAVLLALGFLLADVYALMIWWTHPKGARAMGFPRAGTLPFELPFALPLVTLPEGGGAAAATAPAPPPAMPPERPAQRPEPAPAPEPPPREAAPRPAAPEGGYDLEADPFSKYE